MMQIILYDNWLEKATEKIYVETKRVQRMSNKQIKELMKLCIKADAVEFIPRGTLYQFK